MSTSEFIWYFSYGANMSSAVLERRGLKPLSSEAARLDGYAFGFTHRGLLPIEPAFANIQPEAGSRLHGVLHRLRTEDMARLDRIEGAEYTHEHVEVIGTASGLIAARAYLDPDPVSGLKPSRRYLGSCCEGAREFGLPEAYVARMASHPSVYVPVISDLANLLVGTMEALHRAGFKPELLRMRWHRRRDDRTVDS